jgi:YD repeat-containing protein
MRAWIRFAGLAMVGCAATPPPVLTAGDWRVQPPVAACEARVHGENRSVTLRRYDAEGRLIFVTTAPPDSREAAWLTWRGETLVAVESYLDEDVYGLDRGIAGSKRTIERLELRWEGARLVAVTTARRIYHRDNQPDDVWYFRDAVLRRHDRSDDVWRLSDHEEDETVYEYRGPWLAAVGSRLRFDFDGDRPVAVRSKTGLIFWNEPFVRWTWKGDRVATYDRNGSTGRFEYDAQGRLVLQHREVPNARMTEIWSWEYNERGAVRRMTRRSNEGRRSAEDTVWEYQYDGGREIAMTVGLAKIETTYSGACANVIEGPAAPNVFAIINAAPCVYALSGLFSRCF